MSVFAPSFYARYLAQGQGLSECSVRCLFEKCGTASMTKIIVLHIWSVRELDEERCALTMPYQA